MIDPRPALAQRRLEAMERILVFTGGKGGVGKSVCAAATALLCARSGIPSGLLDLDLHGASAHVFLGVEPRFPEEQGGILPLGCEYGLRLMSVAPFTGDRALPLRGGDVTNAILELLTVTVWGETRCLVVDLPPGFGDEVLEVLRLMRRARIVVVTTPSVVSRRIAAGLLAALRESGRDVVGVIENMVHDAASAPGGDTWRGVPLLAVIPYAPEVERAIGSPRSLVATPVGTALQPLLPRLLG